MRIKVGLILFCLLYVTANIDAQSIAGKSIYNINLAASKDAIISNHIQLGTHQNAKGESFDANSFYFIKNEKPWYPVMGEFHFVRFPKSEWETSILKMKAAGIDIIATYVFWIYHEEQEGKWNWQQEQDLQYFVSLCAKHQMYVWIRVGPWCHGEVRNGGFPDWLLSKCKTRTDDPVYIDYVTKFFLQINQQLKGFYFKDGGTVIGAQIENEFRFNNPKGLAHILHLKKIAVDAGIDVPYYSATGWPGSDLKQTELIPVQGGYPEAPWDKRITALPVNDKYLFKTLRNDESIGADLLGIQKDTANYKGYRYPYATAEVGAGIQITHHRRPIILPEDVLGLAYNFVGSGANLMGYYMFHGGTNQIGKRSTLQESKATKYPNDYPILSYDFQCPIGEWGQIQPSFHAYRKLHYFLNNFGEQLATYKTFFPDNKPGSPLDDSVLRWSIRSNGNNGFVFIDQFQRHQTMEDVEHVRFHIQLNNKKEFIFPQQAITIPAATQAVFPFNFLLDDITLTYATAQPYCILNNSYGSTWVFASVKGIVPELLFDTKNIQSVVVNGKTVLKKNNQYFIRIENNQSTKIQILQTNNQTKDILLLNEDDAAHAWKIKQQNKEILMISNGDIIAADENISFLTVSGEVQSVKVFPASQQISISNVTPVTTGINAVFGNYIFSFKEKKWAIDWKEDIAKTQAAAVIPVDTSKNIFYPLYTTSLSSISGAKYYHVAIPSDILTNVEDVFLQINYEGDTQAAYLNNILIADNFYNGQNFTIGLKRFKNNIEGKSLDLLVTPLQEPLSIFLENEIAQKLAGKKNIAAIRKISFKPQYKAEIKLIK